MQQNTPINIFIPQNTGEFLLLDSGQGNRLEKWGPNILSRPDPQAIWKKTLPEAEWAKANAVFTDNWHFKSAPTEHWQYRWKDMLLKAKLTPFKHTGIFPEQASNWEWLLNQVDSGKWKVEGGHKPKILNLFAYTGASTIVLAKLGCSVTHVDASKQSILWAKENQALNNLPPDSVRWMLDDAIKFCQREVKRGVKYDGIIMDPPAFGHSPEGKTWKFSFSLPFLLELANQLLADHALFLLINAYATNTSALALQNLLTDHFPQFKNLQVGELAMAQRNGRLLSTGIVGRLTN